MADVKFDKAKRAKNDEFYTQMSDIEAEVNKYWSQLRNKVIYCNCDDYAESNFFIYFKQNFDAIGIKKLIATHYEPFKKSYMLEVTKANNKINIKKKALTQNGDFRSTESIELLTEADVVVTNPPFSLYQEYIAQLKQYKKMFLILGNKNSTSYKNIFPMFVTNDIRYGHSGMNKNMKFAVPGQSEMKVINSCWFTNLNVNRENPGLTTNKRYKDMHYPKLDNYDAIFVRKTVDIPLDYDGLMAVPLTFMDKHNPEQFELIDGLNRYALLDVLGTNAMVRKNKSHTCNLNGKAEFFRVVIQKKGTTIPRPRNIVRLIESLKLTEAERAIVREMLKVDPRVGKLTKQRDGLVAEIAKIDEEMKAIGGKVAKATKPGRKPNPKAGAVQGQSRDDGTPTARTAQENGPCDASREAGREGRQSCENQEDQDARGTSQD